MRIGKKVWFASRTNKGNNTTPTYSDPVMIVTRPNYFTVMPATARGYAEFTKYGEKASETWTVVANSRAFDGVFKKGDIMWVDGCEPNKEKELEERTSLLGNCAF